MTTGRRHDTGVVDGAGGGYLSCRPMTRWSVAAVVALGLAMPGVVSAGWRAECRAAGRACRKSHGASLTTTTTASTTTTTSAAIQTTACPSQNCQGVCLKVNGEYWVRLSDALNPCICGPPYECGYTTTTTESTTTTTTGP